MYAALGERWETDNIPYRIDVGAIRLKLLVDLQDPSIVGLNSDRFEIQFVRIPRSSVGPQEDVCFDLLAALQEQYDAIVMRFNLGKALVMPNDHAGLAHLITERINDFVIQKLQELGSSIHQIYFDPKIAEHRRILAADYACPVNGDRLRFHVQVQDRVAIEDSGMTEVDSLWAKRP